MVSCISLRSLTAISVKTFLLALSVGVPKSTRSASVTSAANYYIYLSLLKILREVQSGIG